MLRPTAPVPSSAGELEEMHKAELRPLDLPAAAKHDYDPTHYQSVLFAPIHSMRCFISCESFSCAGELGAADLRRYTQKSAL